MKREKTNVRRETKNFNYPALFVPLLSAVSHLTLILNSEIKIFLWEKL